MGAITELQKRGKVSEALLAMVEGIRDMWDCDDFLIDMDSFGTIEGGVCHGCAAVCAVQKIGNIRYIEVLPNCLVRSVMRHDRLSKAMGDETAKIIEFENAINAARYRDLYTLCSFINVELPAEWHRRWDETQTALINANRKMWAERLDNIELFAKDLQAAGY